MGINLTRSIGFLRPNKSTVRRHLQYNLCCQSSRLISFTKGWLGLKALVVLCRAAYTDEGGFEPPFVGEGIYAKTKASSLRDGPFRGMQVRASSVSFFTLSLLYYTPPVFFLLLTLYFMFNNLSYSKY
jgi:hypothetical protein